MDIAKNLLEYAFYPNVKPYGNQQTVHRSKAETYFLSFALGIAIIAIIVALSQAMIDKRKF